MAARALPGIPGQKFYTQASGTLYNKTSTKPSSNPPQGFRRTPQDPSRTSRANGLSDPLHIRFSSSNSSSPSESSSSEELRQVSLKPPQGFRRTPQDPLKGKSGLEPYRKGFEGSVTEQQERVLKDSKSTLPQAASKIAQPCKQTSIQNLAIQKRKSGFWQPFLQEADKHSELSHSKTQGSI